MLIVYPPPGGLSHAESRLQRREVITCPREKEESAKRNQLKKEWLEEKEK
jgi:hypothetical protein